MYLKQKAKGLIAILSLVFVFWLNSIYDKYGSQQSHLNAPEERDEIIFESNYSHEKIEAICTEAAAKGKIQYQTQAVQFDRPQPVADRKTKCPWASGDNLSPRKGQLMARYEQNRVVALPESSILCSLEITSLEQKTFLARDFYILTLNGIVISSNAEFIFKFFREEKSKISNDKNLSSYIYEWSRILAARIPKNISTQMREYCVGRDIELSECFFTKSSQNKLIVSDSLARWVGIKAYGANQKLNLIVTGDGDEIDDCDHNGLDLKVKVGFYNPKSN